MNYLVTLKNIVLILLVLICCHPSEAQIYVDKNAQGKNDGSAWENAFINIHKGLDYAKENDQIWVAAGTYFPGKPGDPKNATFHITEGIKLYGGFEGTESYLSERIPSEHPTILSGDLEQNDIDDDFDVNRTDNVMTIMLFENKSNTRPLIDGFTFQNGHANGKMDTYVESSGGALFLYGPAIIKNCSFTQNYSSERGGSIFLFDSLGIENTNVEEDQTNFIIDSCQFNNNYSKNGGAVNIRLQNGQVSSAVIRNSNFIKNTSSGEGGGMVLYTSSDSSIMLVDSCLFSQNSSEVSIGGIYSQSFGVASSISIKNSNFEGNHCGERAGAIRMVAQKSSINNKFSIENCEFEDNYTNKKTGKIPGGGAVYIWPLGKGTLASISHSSFKKNRSEGWGGAMAIVTGIGSSNSRINIDSCRFETNYSDCGGAILYQSLGANDSIFIKHSQFSRNTIEDIFSGYSTRGGAICMDYSFQGTKAYSRIEDCLFENNANNGGDGGAISIKATRLGSFSSIYNSTFRGNSSAGKGGAFAFKGVDQAYELEACTFESNKAANGDGHIYEIPHFDGSLFYIFFHGVLWVQIFYSLLLFLISRERTTLYYIMLMIGVSLYYLTFFDFYTIPFFNSISMSTRVFLLHIAMTFYGIGLVKFAQHYLNINYYYPRFKKLVLYFVIAVILNKTVTIFQLWNPSWNLYFQLGGAKKIISNLISLIVILTPVVWAILVSRKGYQPAKYFLLAMLFTGIAIAIGMVSFAKYSHFLNAPLIALQSLILLTIIVLGLANGYRVNLLKKDKARAEKLAELDIAKTRLYNNITHEFRTPLTVIMGTAEMLRGNESEKKLLQRNSKQLLHLINQMLDLSKLEGGALKLEPQQGDIIPFIEYLVESFQSLAESKHIQLTFYKEIEELEMDYDEEKMQAIVSNLISNAIKFTHESGKVVVHAKTDLVDKKSHLMLTFRDSGSGIPSADIPHIFDRFFQVDASDMRRSEGSGIGLALVKELVQLMKGSINVTSKIEKGSVFTFRIPITKEAPFQIEGIHKQEVIAALFSPKKNGNPQPFLPISDELPLALIIEDNRDVVNFLRSCLQKKYKLEVAYNGREGIDKALEIVPDIIISDVMMPEADGYTVCKTLKADERTSHVPIIMLTAKATQEDKLHGLDMGADAYLSKPFHREELEIRLQKLIELRQGLQKHYQSVLNAPPGTIKTVDPFIKKLQKIIEDKMEDESFGISDLCSKVNLSRTQVHRKLKALIGMPITQFIHSVRLQKAYQLLKETDLNVSEVAYQVGFSDHSYFTRLFVKKYETTPSEISKKS